MRLFNTIIIVFASGILGFLSMVFFLGSQEQHQALVNELPSSFLIRFGSFSVVGILVIVILVLINWIISGLLQNHSVKLSKLFFTGSLSVIMACLIGCILFFIH